ncbi:DNA primase [Zavarzinia sp. CC-PAN008]|uniref:DNA primase n=1 Tax=Zavarzinia sp. CC-PAN008 TaxID=3243332 RepID=UPI003F7491F8
MKFTPAFLDELRSRIRLSEVIGRKTKLIRKGSEYAGLCMFHGDRSPSLNVNDQKGVYLCRACGATGDLFKFVQETESLSFAEAVERLADEAGMEIPRATAAEARREEQRAGLAEAMEAACVFFQAQLAAPAGQQARAYLERRGLGAETIARFRLGYAPVNRQALSQYLAARGFTPALLLEGGLTRKPDDGRSAYDYFHDRVMFPILDRRGRVVAFGARALGDAQPKYLNSPETPLFRKGETLFNLSHAREASARNQALAVVEGYMDVIGLAQAGHGAAVAPLGTALTEAQLALAWRMAPEPVLCFDGDAAGQRAAFRAIDRALPLLKPGHSLRFAALPAGLDPDDLVKRDGIAAWNAVLAAARPLVEVLVTRAAAATGEDTPERRAAMAVKLDEDCAAIGDERVRRFYKDAVRDALYQRFRPAPRVRPGTGRPSSRPGFRAGGPGRFDAPPDQAGPLSPEMRALAAAPQSQLDRLIVVAMLSHPDLADRLSEDLGALHLADAVLDRLRLEILRQVATHEHLDSESLSRHLMGHGWAEQLHRLKFDRTLRCIWALKADSDPRDTEMLVRDALNRQRRLVRLEAERIRVGEALAQHYTVEQLDELTALQSEIEAVGRIDGLIREFGTASGREALG